MVIAWRVPTCDSVYSWWLYRSATRGHHAAGTTTQSYYGDTELTSIFPILLVPNARLGSDKYLFDKVIGLTQPRLELMPFRTGSLRSSDSATASDQVHTL